MCSNRVYSLLYKLKRISYIAYETSLQTSSMFNKSDFANRYLNTVFVFSTVINVQQRCSISIVIFNYNRNKFNEVGYICSLTGARFLRSMFLSSIKFNSEICRSQAVQSLERFANVMAI